MPTATLITHLSENRATSWLKHIICLTNRKGETRMVSTVKSFLAIAVIIMIALGIQSANAQNPLTNCVCQQPTTYTMRLCIKGTEHLANIEVCEQFNNVSPYMPNQCDPANNARRQNRITTINKICFPGGLADTSITPRQIFESFWQTLNPCVIPNVWNAYMLPENKYCWTLEFPKCYTIDTTAGYCVERCLDVNGSCASCLWDIKWVVEAGVCQWYDVETCSKGGECTAECKTSGCPSPKIFCN